MMHGSLKSHFLTYSATKYKVSSKSRETYKGNSSIQWILYLFAVILILKACDVDKKSLSAYRLFIYLHNHCLLRCVWLTRRFASILIHILHNSIVSLHLSPIRFKVLHATRWKRQITVKKNCVKIGKKCNTRNMYKRINFVDTIRIYMKAAGC